MRNLKIISFLFLFITIFSCQKDDGDRVNIPMQLTALRLGTTDLLTTTKDVAIDRPIIVSFNAVIDQTTVIEGIQLSDDKGTKIELAFAYLDNNQTVSASPQKKLNLNSKYNVTVSSKLRGLNGETFPGLEVIFTTLDLPITLSSASIAGKTFSKNSPAINIDFRPNIDLVFSESIQLQDVVAATSLRGETGLLSISIIKKTDSIYQVQTQVDLAGYKKFRLIFSDGELPVSKRKLEGLQLEFYTKLDSTLKFPVISDEELLTKVQQQTFKYFWDFAHPFSGLARERNVSGETVTIGGSGFGVMAIVVGIERGFITRAQGVARLGKIVSFLGNTADRFHGVWPHWMNGSTGKTIPFSAKDNGADLVESAFMIQGLTAVRQYLSPSDSEEKAIIDQINVLIDEVEWNWFTQNGQNVLYWHWSPSFAWEMNLPIRGWNEGLIIYTLAASSKNYSIGKDVYTQGWARSGGIVNANKNSYYGYTLPLRNDRGGPLFFSHYSFLGLDPRNLKDQYANYWEQSVNHSLINRAYCIANPRRFVGYSAQSWGLTASDNHQGYSAHSPDNDLGVISPTAAISSIPYTPQESMDAIKHFYYILGDRLWGQYGFYDAFNVTENWTASSYLAIDQGPIIIMIENHRSGLLWDLFMSAPEVKTGLDKLGFTYE